MYSTDVHADDVLVLAPEEGIFLSMQALLQPGDEVSQPALPSSRLIWSQRSFLSALFQFAFTKIVRPCHWVLRGCQDIVAGEWQVHLGSKNHISTPQTDLERIFIQPQAVLMMSRVSGSSEPALLLQRPVGWETSLWVMCEFAGADLLRYNWPCTGLAPIFSPDLSLFCCQMRSHFHGNRGRPGKSDQMRHRTQACV